MKISCSLLSAILLAVAPFGFAAETVYVIDKLLVGVHKEADLNSAIAKVLPTGAKLDVLSHKGELAQIKDHDGAVGWVDVAYLMKDPPAAAALEQLKLDKRALADRVKALEAQSAGKPAPAEGAKVNSLTNENTELKGQLSAQKLKNTELEDKLSQLEKNPALPGTGTVAGELQKANLALTEDLKKANEVIDALRAEAPNADPRVAVHGPWYGGSLSVVALTLGMLGLSFGGGMYLMDYRNRRRHGGFRV